MMWASVHSRKAQWFLRGFAGCRAPFWTLADYVSSDGTTMYNMPWDEAIQAIFTEVKSGFFWSWTLGKHRKKHHKLPPFELLQALPLFLLPSSSLTLSDLKMFLFYQWEIDCLGNLKRISFKRFLQQIQVRAFIYNCWWFLFLTRTSQYHHDQ